MKQVPTVFEAIAAIVATCRRVVSDLVKWRSNVKVVLTLNQDSYGDFQLTIVVHNRGLAPENLIGLALELDGRAVDVSSWVQPNWTAPTAIAGHGQAVAHVPVADAVGSAGEPQRFVAVARLASGVRRSKPVSLPDEPIAA